jgi:hypothetical protein
MFSDHQACYLLHRNFVQRVRIMPHISRQERRTNVATKNSVAVRLRSGRLPGMKVWRDVGSLEYAYRRRQNVIQRNHQIVGRDGRRSGKSCDLAQGMHPGIGASRTLRKNFLACYSSNGRGQGALDRGRLGLNLPSGEIRAVIGQDQFEIAHGDCLESYRRRPSSNSVANLYKALPGVDGCDCRIPMLAQLYYGIHFARGAKSRNRAMSTKMKPGAPGLRTIA